MTAGCYFACYLFALMRNKKAFKKMSIAELLQMEKKNEEIKSVMRSCASGCFRRQRPILFSFM